MSKELMSLKNQLNDAGKYTSIATQMIFIILAGTFGGKYLDKFLGTNFLFTVILSLLSVVVAIYFVVKDLIWKK